MSDTFAMARARKALQEAGLDYSIPLERASSVTNEVWLTPDYVIRVNRQPNQRLRREAALGPLLPADVGYPDIVGYGGQLGADWLIVRRMPGNVLSRCWPTMSVSDRREAVRQLCSILRHLHQVTAPADLPDVAVPLLLDGHRFQTTEPLLEALGALRSVNHVEPHLVDALEEIVRNEGTTIEPHNVPNLVHGDLHFENVLWDSDHISALLDFEFARPGPPDLDLDILLRFSSYPFLHVAEDYEHLTRAEDYEMVPYWLAEDYPELFDHPQLFERLRIYAIAFNVKELLDFPPPRPPRELSRYHPYNRLDLLVRGASHLHTLAGRASYDSMWDLDQAPAPGMESGVLEFYVEDTSPPLGRAASSD